MRQDGPIASRSVLVVIDLSDDTVSLSEPDEFTRFAVRVEGSVRVDDSVRVEGSLRVESEDALARVVQESGLGRLAADGEHVVVDPAALRSLAGPAADERWDEGFAGMCAYAAVKGWVEPDGGVLAHIELAHGAG